MLHPFLWARARFLSDYISGPHQALFFPPQNRRSPRGPEYSIDMEMASPHFTLITLARDLGEVTSTKTGLLKASVQAVFDINPTLENNFPSVSPSVPIFILCEFIRSSVRHVFDPPTYVRLSVHPFVTFLTHPPMCVCMFVPLSRFRPSPKKACIAC